MAGWLAKSLCRRIDNLACTRAYLGSSEDVLDGVGDLGTDTVTLDQADSVVALEGVSVEMFAVETRIVSSSACDPIE
jgi:hypothetical protein